MDPLSRLKKLNTTENLWIYILTILKEKPSHAWEILKEIEKKFYFKPGKITPYRVLYSLEKEGLVESKIKERRRIYEITEKGIQLLDKAKDFYKEILEKIK